MSWDSLDGYEILETQDAKVVFLYFSAEKSKTYFGDQYRGRRMKYVIGHNESGKIYIIIGREDSSHEKIAVMEIAGNEEWNCIGGGFVILNYQEKEIVIFGESQSYGKDPHRSSLTKGVFESVGYEVTILD